jgi:hypothetical protein
MAGGWVCMTMPATLSVGATSAQPADEISTQNLRDELMQMAWDSPSQSGCTRWNRWLRLWPAPR